MSGALGNVVVGQSGGPTAVINQSLAGVVLEARALGAPRILGARNGIQGVLDDRFLDLTDTPEELLEAVARTPGSALGSVRKKPTREECARALEVFRRHDVHVFFYIGGNDTAEAALLMNEVAAADAYELRVFHVPKTVDNDLCVTDHCPGYPSAARFVALAMLGNELDNRSLGGVKIDLMMGRHAGWLTAAAALARQEEGDGPHLIYLPERAFSVERFQQDVVRTVEEHGRCVVALSEGVHDAAGRLVLETHERDSHGNVQLSGSGALGDFLAERVKEALGAGPGGKRARVRADTYGYLQRSFLGVVSEVDVHEAREVGREAVRAAARDAHASGSIVIRRRSDGPAPGEYRAAFERVPLERLARVTRPMEEAFLSGDHDVSPAFLDYLRPLVGELPPVARLAD
jgi:6-phosphofructokinase 1